MPEDNLSRREMAEEYGFAFKFFKQDPELWRLLKRAQNNNWSQQRFITELQDSKWFKTHSVTFREASARKAADPASWKAELGIEFQRVQQMAKDLGSRKGPKNLKRLAWRSLMYGLSDDQLRNYLSHSIRPGKDGHYGGSLAAMEQQVRETAYRNGIRLSDKAMRGWMRRIVRGHSTVEDYENHIRHRAERTWGAFAKDIKAGADLMDLADPYLESMKAILELPDGEVDLFTPKIRRALDQRNSKGEFEPMNLVDFEESLRRDPRWRRTQNASDTLSEATFGLLNRMGFRA